MFHYSQMSLKGGENTNLVIPSNTYCLIERKGESL